MTICATCARYNRDCPLDEGAEVCGQYVKKQTNDRSTASEEPHIQRQD